jgi:hypothetical protein
MSGPEQESFVVDMWTTDAERRQQLIDGLLALYRRFQSSEGFVEGRVLQGSGGTVVLSYLRMRSAVDQQRLDDTPEIQSGLEALRKIARAHRGIYDLIWVFTPPGDHRPVSRSRGAY